MGVTTICEEFTSTVAPTRLFKGLFTDSHNLMPKLMPQDIKSIELVHGSGEIGSIKQTNFAEGGPYKCMKHRLDAIDEANYMCKYTLIGGDVLGDKLESAVHELKLEAAGEGCVGKMTIHYHTKGDIVVTEEDIKEGKVKGLETFKVLEAYLLANPSVYA